MKEEKQELRKDLGLLSVFALVVGSVLGAGAFMKPAAVLTATGDSSMALLAWCIGAFFSMAGGLTLCELGVLFPKTGGIYIYLENMYGQKTAYLYGWMMTVLYGPAVVGALAGYFSAVFCLLFSVPENYMAVIAGSVLLFILFVNSIGVKEAGYIQTLATFCKLLPVGLIIFFGIFKGSGDVFAKSHDLLPRAHFSIAVIATLFAYDGWANVAALAGEMKNPSKILPRAIIGGLIVLSVIYVLINIAFLKVLSTAEMVSLGHDAAAIAAQKLFGFYGGNLIAVGIMISILGGLNGYVMTVSRLIFALGERRLLPGSSFLAKVDKSSSTPVNAVIFLTLAAFIYCQVLNADRLTDVAMFAVWVFFILAFYAVVIARKKFPNMQRSYKVPLYPVVPLIAIIGAVYIAVGMILNYTFNVFVCLALTLSGIPVFYLTKKKIVMPINWKKYMILVCGALMLIVFGFMNRMVDHRPVLTVAVEMSMPFVAFENEKGEPDGLDIELIKKIAEKEGYKVRFRATEFENVFMAIEKGFADVAIGEITVTPEREEIVSFTDSYHSGNLGLLLHKDIKGKVKNVGDLKNKKIAVKAKTTGESYLLEHEGKEDFIIEKADTMKNLIRQFNERKVDAVIFDRVILEELINGGKIPQGLLLEIEGIEKYAFAYKKDHKELGQKLNKALNELKEKGELKKIIEKWLPNRVVKKEN